VAEEPARDLPGHRQDHQKEAEALKKPPAFPVYTKDFDTDERVQLMDLAEEGAYGRLLRHQWREGSIPQDHKALAKILRVPRAKVSKLWPALAPCFQPHPSSPGRLINGKTERVRAQQEQFLRGRSEAGRRGAAVRYGSAIAEPAMAEPLPSVSVAVAVPVSVSVPEQSSVVGNGGEPPPTPATPEEAKAVALERLGPPEDQEQRILDHQRQVYAQEVWDAFLARTGQSPTKTMSTLEWDVVRGWMEAGIPLRIVMRGIDDTKGTGRLLSYYDPSVREAAQKWRANLQGRA
jgi:hypothetical protein